jgi:uncharacterized Zn finger protein
MVSVADLVEPGTLRERAGEYLERAGEVLRASGHVRIVEFGSLRVTGEVDDGSTRHVALESTPAGLDATCDCGHPDDTLCPHAVAVAIETWNRAPNRS